MIPLPVAIQPWMLKVAAIVGVLAIAYTSGCRTQKSIDLSTIQRLKAVTVRDKGIINTQQTNINILRGSLERQNQAWIELSNEGKRREAALKVAHQEAIERFESRSARALRDAARETEELRERMVGLSVGEACHEAMKEIVR